MQFKLLAAALLASSVAAEYTNYMDCLVKKECKNDEACIKECFQTDKANPDLVGTFIHCNSGRCNKEGAVTKDTTDWTKYYECLPKCYNNVIGKPSGTQVDLNAKASGSKDDATTATGNSTTTKPPAPAPTSSAFKTVPSVVAALFLAALAL
ncbi:hypothetical protein CONCODRAFT_86441 [Conidiobolus coronatus NRRL 28638]|uniref:Extracellular membrane protein CFEM domain-containing protein n=1 Tax=Conidiobolus coronatus (strain ATCC 28846 / CBS 209.66 / NRRL 28638) TaxID=796925 RepID=A0A137P0C8_CONC2|nr:hypothetical protein CONCODRAFT_86441 [Conidiobolus coronatus NRRL 28638]|eukprot:KXN68496.1 hypothetical protein CONCODRAFT_86441 [Conidiobolus coronatus NRRL 28638]